jgi:hypothetical protein
MDGPFLGAVGVSLCLLTLLIVIRKSAAGAGWMATAAVAVEMWLAAALWVLGLLAFTSSRQSPAAPRPLAAAADWLAGGGSDSSVGPVRAYAAVALALLLLAHVLSSLRGAVPGGMSSKEGEDA